MSKQSEESKEEFIDLSQAALADVALYSAALREAQQAKDEAASLLKETRLRQQEIQSSAHKVLEDKKQAETHLKTLSRLMDLKAQKQARYTVSTLYTVMLGVFLVLVSILLVVPTPHFVVLGLLISVATISGLWFFKVRKTGVWGWAPFDENAYYRAYRKDIGNQLEKERCDGLGMAGEDH